MKGIKIGTVFSFSVSHLLVVTKKFVVLSYCYMDYDFAED